MMKNREITTLNRRYFIRGLTALGAATIFGVPRFAMGQTAQQPLWINIQVDGGWDQALFCDPKPQLRQRLGGSANIQLYLSYINKGGATAQNPNIAGNGALAIRTTPNNGIAYLAAADFHSGLAATTSYKPLFPTYYDRITIFNGVDTETNNHATGKRYSATGSMNESFPCFSAQMAACIGKDLPLGFTTSGGWGETGGLVSSTPLSPKRLSALLKLTNPNDISGDNNGTDFFYPEAHVDLIKQFRSERITRQIAQAGLPSAKEGLDALKKGYANQGNLKSLKYTVDPYAGDFELTRILFDAYRNGIAASMNIDTGAFDAHSDNEGTTLVGGGYGGTGGLFGLFEFIKKVIDESESPSGGKAPIPVVLMICSDFGRSPHYTGTGTDHWPTSSMMIVQNTLAKSLLGNRLPTNTVIGKTTDGDSSVALRPVKINPSTFVADDAGVILKPGHVIGALRRVAGIHTHPALRGFDIAVDRDLNIG